MAHIDIDDLRKKIKKDKVAVSLYLDKNNLDYLKKDLKRLDRWYEGVSLSSVFDDLLDSIVKEIRKDEET